MISKIGKLADFLKDLSGIEFSIVMLMEIFYGHVGEPIIVVLKKWVETSPSLDACHICQDSYSSVVMT
jgi:hypothetical protein